MANLFEIQAGLSKGGLHGISKIGGRPLTLGPGYMGGLKIQGGWVTLDETLNLTTF